MESSQFQNKPVLLTPPSFPPTQPKASHFQPQRPLKRKNSRSRNIIAGVSLFFLLAGGLISLYLTQINQDVRQQATDGSNLEDTANPTTPPTDPTTPPTDPTAPPTDPTTPPTDPTAPPTDPTAPPATPTTPAATPTTLLVDPTIEPTAESTSEITDESITEPTAEPTSEVTDESITEPTAESDGEEIVDNSGSSSSSSSSSSSNASVNINSGTRVIGTTVGGNAQPDKPAQLPQSGPEDWLKYLQIGLGALGAGALLLLFL